MTRRDFAPALASVVPATLAASQSPVVRKGRLKQAITMGCLGRKMSFEEKCATAARLGVKGIDLVAPNTFPTLKKYALIPTMLPGGGGIRDGVNRKENHDAIYTSVKQAIADAAAAGAPNVIILSGERRGMSDAQGAENSAIFLNRVKPMAEDKGVTLCLELLNSKVDHPDYMCDHTKWGVSVMKQVNSPRVKLLYDIYHMQIMEGDIIRTIRENIQWIGHFHTAGNPGRHEPDETQELNYRPIAQAILDTGFTGYLAHEYGPVKDPVASLEKTLAICDV